MITYTKKDANTIGISETKSEVIIKSYDYDFLLKQKGDIQAQKDRDNAQRDIELAEINALIIEANKLGIIAKPIIKVI